MQIQSVLSTPSAVPSPTPDPNARCNSNKPSFPVENGHWIWDDQWIILCDSERGIGKVNFLFIYHRFTLSVKRLNLTTLLRVHNTHDIM